MHNLQRGRKSEENNKIVKPLPRGLFASAELSYVCKVCCALKLPNVDSNNNNNNQ